VAIGRFLLSGLVAASRGSPRIEVSLAVDDTGALCARARDVAGSAVQEVTFARGFPEEAGEEPVAAGVQGNARALCQAS
jgi:molecular chaperone DnaK (HSP70)